VSASSTGGTTGGGPCDNCPSDFICKSFGEPKVQQLQGLLA
jgi:hypothetical protein